MCLLNSEKIEKKVYHALSFLMRGPTPAVGMIQIMFEWSFENSRL